MWIRTGILTALLTSALLLAASPGCRGGARVAEPPPDARRPVLKTKSELAAERAARIEAGDVDPEAAPPRTSQPPSTQPDAPEPLPPLPPRPNAISAEILLINRSVLTVPEVLYPIHQTLLDLRERLTGDVLVREVTDEIRIRTQQEIGSLLIYDQAIAKLNDQQREILDQAINREIEARITRQFDGSATKFETHLAAFGMTRKMFREWIARQMVVRNYTRDQLGPRVQLRRDELLSYYRRNIDEYRTPETRELLMIALPYKAFLPDGVAWADATRMQQGRARLTARRAAREAYAALADEPFDVVARKFSRGPQAEEGGSWGFIGAPLNPPLNKVTARIFEFAEGEYSEPLEAADGWYIVKCGATKPAKLEPFSAVQDALRARLEDERFARLATDYVLRLAEKATIANYNEFLRTARQKALDPNWPSGDVQITPVPAPGAEQPSDQ